MLSELDKALIRAQENPEKYEQRYYELFLNTELLVPTWDVPKPENEGVRLAEEDETIAPVTIENKEGNYILLFDSKERLSDWAEDKKLGITGLKGYDILNIFTPEFLLVLNPNSDHPKEFCEDEIRWLLSSIEVKE